MKEETLHEKIRELAASKGNPDADKKLAISGLAEFVYFNLYRFKLQWFDEDTRSDFLIWMYPKFDGIVRNFNPERSSVGTYLYMMIRHGYRSFMKERFGSEARQHAFEAEEMTRILSEQSDSDNSGQNQCAGSTEPLYAKRRTGSRRTITEKKKEILSRRILLLACKCGELVDDTMIQRAADLTGEDPEYFRTRIERIRERTSEKSAKARLNREKQNMYYIRAMGCAYEMRELDRSSARYRLLERRHAFCLQRLASARRQAKHQIKTPSNRELSRALGICRGTVDSTLASLRGERYAVSS